MITSRVRFGMCRGSERSSRELLPRQNNSVVPGLRPRLGTQTQPSRQEYPKTTIARIASTGGIQRIDRDRVPRKACHFRRRESISCPEASFHASGNGPDGHGPIERWAIPLDQGPRNMRIKVAFNLKHDVDVNLALKPCLSMRLSFENRDACFTRTIRPFASQLSGSHSSLFFA